MFFAGLSINEVIIDPHYKENHPEMDDEIILNLIAQLEGINDKPISVQDEFFYFKLEPIFFNKKPYRLVFVIEKGQRYIGIINAFRIKEKKYGTSI